MENGSIRRMASEGAADASPGRRPGVPQKREPSPIGAAHWVRPPMQPGTRGALKDAQRATFTATFGTGQPPKGLSGAMRRAAYQIPDYRIRRWMLLMAADRVDTLEWQLSEAVRSPAAWASLALATLGTTMAAVAWSRRRAAARRRPSSLARTVLRALVP